MRVTDVADVSSQACRSLAMLTYLKFHAPKASMCQRQSLKEARDSLMDRRVLRRQLPSLVKDLVLSLARTKAKLDVVEDARNLCAAEGRESLEIGQDAIMWLYESLCVSATLLSRLAMSLDGPSNLLLLHENWNNLWPPVDKWRLLDDDRSKWLREISSQDVAWTRSDEVEDDLGNEKGKPTDKVVVADKFFLSKMKTEAIGLETELWDHAKIFYSLLHRFENSQNREGQTLAVRANVGTADVVNPGGGIPLAYVTWHDLDGAERRKEFLTGLKAVHSDLTNLSSLQKDIASRVAVAKDSLDQIENSTVKTLENSRQGKKHLARAARNKAKGWTWEGGAFGAVVGGIVGLLMGPPGALMGSAAGGAMGGAVGRALQIRRDTQLREIEEESSRGASSLESASTLRPPVENGPTESAVGRRILPSTSVFPISHIAPPSFKLA